MTVVMRLKRSILGVAAAAALAGATASAAPVVEGYLPSHRGLAATLAAIDLHAYSDIALAFINPDTGGRFTNGDVLACMTDRMLAPIPAQTLRAAVDTIHAAHDRAIGALAGAAMPKCAGDWTILLAPARRGATVDALVALAETYKLDGLDVDIEGDLLARLVGSGDYTPFVTALGRALHARHKTLGGTTASYVGGMLPLDALPAFDRVEVMAYDNTVPGEEQAGLSRFRSELYLWLGRGVARDRLVMGLPFYGHGYGDYRPGYSYGDLVGAFGPKNGDVIGSLCPACSYITFNGPATIAQKTALAVAKGGGIMVWEVSEDAPGAPLLHAVEAGLRAQPPALPVPAAGKPGDGRPLNTPDVRTWTIYGTSGYGLVSDKDLLNGQALEVRVAKPTEASWDVGVTSPITGAARSGDYIKVAVPARLKAADPDTQLDIPAVIEAAAAPNAAVAQGRITVTTQWQWLTFGGVMTADQPGGTLNAVLQIGNAAKVIDLGPAVITDEGPQPIP